MAVKRNWVKETKRSEIPQEDAHIVQGYIIQDEQKHFLSLQLDSHTLTLNLLHSDRQLIQYFESWLGTCSISYSTSQQLPFFKTYEQASNYLWFSPHVSITDMFSYLKDLGINVNNVSINEPRLNWFIHELTSEVGET